MDSKSKTKFTDELDVHAIKDLADSTTTGSRVFWVVVIITCFVQLIVQFHGTITEYQKETLASTVMPNTPDRAPLALYCPVNWLNVEAATEIGLLSWGNSSQDIQDTNEMVRFLDGFLVSGQYDEGNAWREEKYPPMSQEKFDEMSTKLTVIMASQNISLQELFLKISEDPRDHRVIKAAYFGPDPSVSVTKTVNNIGVCYFVKYPKKLTVTRLLFMYLAIYPATETPTAANFGNWSIQAANRLFLGEEAQSVLPLGGLAVEMPGTYHLSIRTRRMIRVSHRKTGQLCSKVKGYSAARRSRCLFDRLNKRHCNECEVFNPSWVGNTESDTADVISRPQPLGTKICNYLDSSAKHCMQKLYELGTDGDKLWDECPMPCDEMVYEVSHVAEPSKTNEGVIIVSYENPFQGISIEQYRAYTLGALFSNIGGTFGLWCGASVLTVAQMVYIPVARAMRKWKADDSD